MDKNAKIIGQRARACMPGVLLAGMVVFVAGGLGVAPALAQPDDPEVLPPARQDMSRMPGRVSGEAVMPGREAFDRSQPQFTIGRRDRSQEAEAVEEMAQLVGEDRSLAYECDLGERVELVGSNNQVIIQGHCLGLNIVGDRNQVEIEVVDDVRIEGDGNDVRWGRGFTLAKPDVLQLRGNNSSGPLARSDVP